MIRLRFFNTKSRQIEDFYSQQPGKVFLYTCGPTVYNSLHIGNWLAYIRWDTLVRLLKIGGYEVNRVLNITDVGHLVSDADEGEDKLEIGAKRDNLTAFDVAKRYEQEFYQGMKALNLLPPTSYAKATDYIKEQIELIKCLEQKNFTYKISDGIYFDTTKFSNYSDFAKLNLRGQEAGARVKQNPEKKHPWDFALWKFSPQDKKRSMEWDSPWGKGFPGWHIECSAIAMTLLGQTLDIHTGGIDHIPIHHTNEIAQSEAATGKPFANFWLHNNFLLINDTKLSKSLDNGLTLTDLGNAGFSPLDFKMMVLQSHYRSEANFNWDILSTAQARLKELVNFSLHRYQPYSDATSLPDNYFDQQILKISQYLADDMNTPMALSSISEVVNQVNGRGISSGKYLQKFENFIGFLDKMFGFDLLKISPINEEQASLITKRLEARENKDFAVSDQIRKDLEKQGVILFDQANRTVWGYK